MIFLPGLAFPPKLIIPDLVTQFGGQAFITCSWSSNKYNKKITWKRLSIQSNEEHFASFIIDSNEGKVHPDAANPDNMRHTTEDQANIKNLTIKLEKVLQEDRGPYWCVVEVQEPQGNTLTSQRLSLQLKRKYCQGKREMLKILKTLKCKFRNPCQNLYYR